MGHRVERSGFILVHLWNSKRGRISDLAGRGEGEEPRPTSEGDREV